MSSCRIFLQTLLLVGCTSAFQMIRRQTSIASKQSHALPMAPASYGWTGKPDKSISNIFEANVRWKYHKLSQDPKFFEKLGSGHAPKYLWIGCADARVPANEIMGEDAGSVFVLRNVANMVVNTDFNLMSGLQYAVSVLKVPHIIVCGHYDCGGVRASMQRKDHGPPLENWLRNIRDVYRLHRKELDAISDPEQRHRRLVELNVIEQCINLFKTGVVQRQRVETFRERQRGVNQMDPKSLDYTTPRIHACVFDPKTGDLNRLEVDFREYIEDLHTIYDLYTLDEPDILTEKPHAPRPATEVYQEVYERDPNEVYGRYGTTDGAYGDYATPDGRYGRYGTPPPPLPPDFVYDPRLDAAYRQPYVDSNDVAYPLPGAPRYPEPEDGNRGAPDGSGGTFSYL